MRTEHHYTVTSVWTGDRGSGTSGYRDYDRAVTLHAEGKPDILASSDRVFRGDASKWNPEDLLVAALSECHLLSYLHAAVTAGVVVTAYEDSASAIMAEDGLGGGSFREVVLRPVVTVADAGMCETARDAHEQAHRWCFIANSVNFPVIVEPVIRVHEG